MVDPDDYAEAPDEAFVQDCRRRLQRRLTTLRRAPGKGGYAALYSITPDWHPILDRLPAVDGLYCAVGFSGHGFNVNLPNPDLFVSMYVRKEALLSSQIEGTQASLDDVLAYEVHAEKSEMAEEAAVVVNYVEAMRYGLTRLETLPLSLLTIALVATFVAQDVARSQTRSTCRLVACPVRHQFTKCSQLFWKSE